MAGLSPFAIAQVHNLFFNKGTWPSPTFYLAAFLTNPTDDTGTGKVEPASGAYARVLIPSSSMGTANNTTGTMTSVAEIAFPQATAAYTTTVKGFGMYDALTAGNLWDWVPLGTPITVASGQTLSVAAGSLSLIRV